MKDPPAIYITTMPTAQSVCLVTPLALYTREDLGS